jgi:hypothetical protein
VAPTGFTPGPWTFHEPWAGFSKITDAADNLIFGIARGDPEEAQAEDVCEANARLIAKAPDMARLITDIEESFTADDSYALLRDACRKLLSEIEQVSA